MKRVVAKRMDLRVMRTRKVLLRAFFGLVQDRHYDEINVSHIVERAAVSRSTFYAHFAGKDALLAASIATPFSTLARVLESHDHDALTGLLDHFRANRALARCIFVEPIRRRIVLVLTDQIEDILANGGPWKRGPLIMPSRLAAIQLAELLLAPIVAWLAGAATCSSATLAHALLRVATAAMEAMTVPSPAGSR